MKCKICESKNISIVKKNYFGYIQGSYFDIFNCNECNTSFIAEKVDKKIYDIIYNNPKIPGYDRYFHYANEIKKQADPLFYLAQNESTYYPIYELLVDEKKLDILEIGCGYGYLTYALKKRGHSVKGIDIAQTAIAFAVENFGSYFEKTDIKTFCKNCSTKFDMIVATEVIEHLENPIDFIENCKLMLSENGRIVLTTPNKDYSPPNSVWQTDLPPVHITWLGKRSFQKIGEIFNMITNFTSFKNYYPSEDNRLIRYIRSRKIVFHEHILTSNGEIVNEPLSDNKMKLLFKKLFFRNRLIRGFSNFIYNKLIERMEH
jgi:2-polyprenyl-3-methyl-5-hydroxy-6-metoxy-1,4-benzoquinol methylase